MTYGAVFGAVVGTATSAGTAAAASSASNRAATKAAKLQKFYADQAAAEAQRKAYEASSKLKPYANAGLAALPKLEALADQPKYGVGQFNAENGTSLSMADMLRQYSPGQYQQDWGQDPRTLLQQGNFQASPDYAWRREQGQQGIQSQAAAGGGLLSGATLKALENYNSNLASQEYGNWFSRDLQNRQLGLGNFWQANGANASNRAMQLGQYNTGFNQNLATNAQKSGILQGLAQGGQNAAEQQGAWVYGSGKTLADILGGTGKAQAALALEQGQNTAAGWMNVGNAINSGISSGMNNYMLAQALGNGTGSNRVGSGNDPGAVSPNNYTEQPYK
jgi:hypothetical protein